MPASPVKMKYGRAKRVFPPILEAVKAKRYPYHRPPVQDELYMPEGMQWGSREHRLYLFILCIWMKGGITSDAAIKALSRFYADYPEVFLPENYTGLEKYELLWVIDWLGWILPQYGLGVNINEAKQHFVWNLLKIGKHWGCDPLNLFEDVQKHAEETWQSYQYAKRVYDALSAKLIRNPRLALDELLETPNGFYGFQHKMVSMIAYFYVHAGCVKPFAYPVPVDFHILRVLFATGVLWMPHRMRRRPWQYRERIVFMARKITLRYVVEMKEDPQALADGLWLLSRTNCRWHPGNRCSVEKTRKGRHRKITDIPFKWTPYIERRYDKSCGICPVENLCGWTIPSAYYYVKGAILVRGHRQRPNPPQIRLLDVPLVPPRMNGNGHANGNGHKPTRVLPVLDESQSSLFD